jgi:hypothetical protein
MTPPSSCMFVIILHLNRTWLFIWTTLNFLYLRMICTKFHWNWPAGSEDFFFNFSVFLFDCYYLPLEKGIALNMNSFESPLPKDDLCQLWLQLAQPFWRSRKWKCLTERHADGQADNGRSEKLTWTEELESNIFFAKLTTASPDHQQSKYLKIQGSLWLPELSATIKVSLYCVLEIH